MTTPAFGFAERFPPGDRARVEEVLGEIAATGAEHLRVPLSWAADEGRGETGGGRDWTDWLLPRLAREVTVLPCVAGTPPALSRSGQETGAPWVPGDYAAYLGRLLDRHGRRFRHLMLWPVAEWDAGADPDLRLYTETVISAARGLRRRGWKPVLALPCPIEARLLSLFGERGLLAEVAAVALDGRPVAPGGAGWAAELARLRGLLDRHNPMAEIWIGCTGHASARGDGIGQVRAFTAAMDQPVARVYWQGWRDGAADGPAATAPDGEPKLLARCLAAGGPAAAQRLAALCLAAPALACRARPVVVTGGAGFVGANLADGLLLDGREVIVVDSLARPGVERNLDWLCDRHGPRLHPAICDIRDADAMAAILADAGAVCHLAAQTAVTTSLSRPGEDFEVNLGGTFTLLEAARRAAQTAGPALPFVFASTNKVYGDLAALAMTAAPAGHRPADAELHRHGVGEDRALDFRTPYGCSKGAADQYVLDYAASFGLPATVLRMSCIYGPRQFGTEDQGWVAHFMRRVMAGQEITIYGDGLQTRDILHVADAVAAWRLALDRAETLAGRAFNLGGGPRNTVSLVTVLGEIARLTGRSPRLRHAGARAGDQPWFVADTRALARATGWRAAVPWQEGLATLHHWLAAEEPGTAAQPAARGTGPDSERMSA